MEWPPPAYSYYGSPRKRSLISILGFKEIFGYRVLSSKRIVADKRRVFALADGYDRSNKPIASAM
jgi:hypothetical protein